MLLVTKLKTNILLKSEDKRVIVLCKQQYDVKITLKVKEIFTENLSFVCHEINFTSSIPNETTYYDHWLLDQNIKTYHSPKTMTWFGYIYTSRPNVVRNLKFIEKKLNIKKCFFFRRNPYKLE